MPWKANSGMALLLGNEAIARGALEAGMRLFACYPGTPSSEVAEALTRAKACADFVLEYSVNEKVAFEVACGAALAGAKSMVAMKHVGLNVAADPLFTAAYTGMPGGLVILSADDPGCHSSQNEQDNRHYARFAGVPCFEPASAQEAKDMTRAAFEMARELELPVIIRTTTRISHLRGPVRLEPLQCGVIKNFEKNPQRFVPVPVVARKRHPAQLEQLKIAESMADASPFNKIYWPGNTDKPWGIIASGVARDYLADALFETGQSNKFAVLELGQTWPLPRKTLFSFIDKCSKILVLEEGSPLLEKDLRALAKEWNLPQEIQGKDALLHECGEYSTASTIARLRRWQNLPEIEAASEDPLSLPGRLPNLCPGCAHRGIYYAARKVFGDEVVYSSDIGCYTLGLLPPLKMADFLVCMGSSVSAGSGFSRASQKPVVSFIGDSTFFHSGMTGLANAIYNQHDLLLVILDNGTTAMTGHQPNPGMRQDVLGEAATHLDIESIVRALGARHVARVKASNYKKLRETLEEMKNQKGCRVLIAEEPCVLYARRLSGKKRPRVAQVLQQGAEAEACLRELACPAFKREDGKLAVDENLCSGCMFCLQIAPASFGVKAS